MFTLQTGSVCAVGEEVQDALVQLLDLVVELSEVAVEVNSRVRLAV